MLDTGTSCALSLHLMLTSSTLQHSFDISVAFRVTHNLLAANWVVVRATAFVWSDCTGVPFELSGWNFQHLSRIDVATKWRWQRFFCNFSSRILWRLRIILDQTMYKRIGFIRGFESYKWRSLINFSKFNVSLLTMISFFENNSWKGIKHVSSNPLNFFNVLKVVAKFFNKLKRKDPIKKKIYFLIFISVF